MLQVLRDSMKYLAWILWAVIALFVLYVFVDFGRSSRYGQGGRGQAAATVGKETVSYQEYEQEYRQLEDQMRQQLGAQYTPELAEQLKLPMQALNRLVSKKILLQEAKRLNLQVSDAELRRSIVDMPVFQDAQGNFVGPELYQRLVRRLGFTPEGFEQSTRESILLQRLYDALQHGVVVSDAEVMDRYRQQVEKAKIRYVSIPFAASVGQVAVSDAEIQKYYDTHKDQFKAPEQRVGDYLLLDQKQLESGVNISEQELRSFYQEHQADYTPPAQVHARHILVPTPELASQALDRLHKGEDFATVAKELSKDPGSAQNGGDLGWFGKGRMVPEFEQAAFAAQPHQVIGPVKTQFGYHVIEVLEKRDAQPAPFEAVQSGLRQRLAAERTATQAETRIKEIAAELQKAGSNAAARMKELGTQPGLEFGTTEPFTRQGAIAPLGSSPQLNMALFRLQKGGLSEPTSTARGWVVVRLADIKPPHVPALGEIRDAVRRNAEQDKQRQAAFTRLADAKSKAGAGASLDSIAGQLGLTVQESQEFGAGAAVVPGIGYAPEVTKEVLHQPVGAMGGPTAVAGSAVMYQVASKTGVDQAAFAKQKDTLRQQMEGEQVNGLLSSLINERKQQLGVTFDPQLVKSLESQGQSPTQQQG